MYDSNYSKELEHYGVKGMKWRKRKNRPMLRQFDAKGEFVKGHFATDQEMKIINLSRIDRFEDQIIRATGDKKKAKRVGDALESLMKIKLSDIVKDGTRNTYKKIDSSIKSKSR